MSSTNRKSREKCPDHPKAKVNDPGGEFVLCAVCGRQLMKIIISIQRCP